MFTVPHLPWRQILGRTRMDAPHARFFDSDFYLAEPPPSHDHHHGAELPHRYLPGPPGRHGTGDRATFIPFGISHTHAYIAEDYGPRHLTTLDGTKRWRHNRHEGLSACTAGWSACRPRALQYQEQRCSWCHNSMSGRYLRQNPRSGPNDEEQPDGRAFPHHVVSQSRGM